MSTNLVIVAIPAEDDYIWKLSSEKIPHLTLLFLGEADDPEGPQIQRIAEFMEHAVKVSNMGPFYLEVDHRGKLGADEADVLFFDKGWDSEEIEQLRGWLLQNNDIKTLHDAAPQFPEWVPHLTMGYPDSPAKEDERDYPGIGVVKFDRLALWFGDYEGPEFRLKRNWAPHLSEAAAWSEATSQGEEFVLEHYGVKGMKWGRRKSESGGSEVPTADNMKRVDAKDIEGSTTRAYFRSGKKIYPKLSPETRWKVAVGGGFTAMSPAIRAQMKEADRQIKVEKADGKWEKQFKENKEFPRVHNTAADQMDKFLPAHNKKYKDVDFTKPENAAKKKKYEDEYMKEFDKQYGIASAKVYGSNPSGTKKVTYDPKSGLLKLQKTKPVKHAADDEEEEETLLFMVVRNETNGHITGAYPVLPDDVDETMEHTIDLDNDDQVFAHITDVGAEFLEHYGVKGMKWGQRKQRFQSRLHERRVTAEEKTRAKRPARDVKAYPTIGTSKRQKARVDTKGGEDFPPAEDAIKVAVAKRKLEKSGPDALSNKELKDLETRLNLENNVTRLTGTKKPGVGKKFVDGLLGKGNGGDLPNQAGRKARKLAGPVAGKAARKVVLKV